jgi:outer membrane protein assembly factor BamB
MGLVICVIWGFAIHNFLNDLSIASASPLVCEQDSPGVELAPNTPQLMVVIQPGRGYRGFQRKSPVVCGLRLTDGALGRHFIINSHPNDLPSGNGWNDIEQSGNLLYLIGRAGICAAQETGGNVNWCRLFPTPSTGSTLGAVQFDRDDGLFLVRTATQLFAFAASDGRQVWEMTTNPANDVGFAIFSPATPALEQMTALEHGVVYISLAANFPDASGQTQWRICSLQARTGQPIWCRAVPRSTAVAQLVSGNGILYAETATDPQPAYSSNLTGVSLEALRASDGTLLWTHKLQCDQESVPMLAAGGMVIIPTNGCGPVYPALPITLDAFSANGNLLWHAPLQFITAMTQVNGVVYVTNQSDKYTGIPSLLSIRLADGQLLRTLELSQPVIRLVADQDTLFVQGGFTPLGNPSSLTAVRLSDGKALWQVTSCDNPTNTALPGDEASDGAPRHCYWQQYYTQIVAIGIVSSAA